MGQPVPPFIMAKANVKDPAPTVYRCTKGHRWQSAEATEKNSLVFPIGMAGAVYDVCPHCLFEWVKRQVGALGKVEKVNE